jgi:hypothetical protein
VKKTIEDKVKGCLKAYISKTNRWDLESIKLDITSYQKDRPARLLAKAQAKGKGKGDDDVPM